MSHPAVVRVYATTQDPDYDCPWQSLPPEASTGSGVVIGPGQILTGAHVVANATFLQVQKISDPDKAIARVTAICHDADLALLSVEDKKFFEGVRPAELGDLPDRRDRVSVVGFPVGGEEVSITEGVVSRLEVQCYSHSQRHLLAVTIDAAINDGNSGGPVFRDGKVAGIAFQSLSDAENIGEIVPAPLIRHFLKGVRQGRSPQVPGLGITTQSLENPALRRKIGLGERQSGVLVQSVEFGGSASGLIEPGDALMEIDGLRIANNGTVLYRSRYRTRFDVVLGEHFIGDTIKVALLRQGQRLEQSIELRTVQHLVPRSQYDRLPTYFVFAGLVFQVLCRDLLCTWDDWEDEAPKEFLHYYFSGRRTEARQQVLVISQILADEVNVGYEDFYNESVLTIDGHHPKDMADLVRCIEGASDLVEIVTATRGVIVLDAAAARASHQRILKRYRIDADRSPDLVASTPALAQTAEATSTAH